MLCTLTLCPLPVPGPALCCSGEQVQPTARTLLPVLCRVMDSHPWRADGSAQPPPDPSLPCRACSSAGAAGLLCTAQGTTLTCALLAFPRCVLLLSERASLGQPEGGREEAPAHGVSCRFHGYLGALLLAQNVLQPLAQPCSQPGQV